MPPDRTVLVTGISGNLGARLLPLLSDFHVVGVDTRPPGSSGLARFEQTDLGREPSCWQLIELLRETGARSVIHLAFVLDPLRSGVLDPERMWQINVAGTARVMEAVSVVNRTGGQVRQFIFASSVAAYGPETAGPVKEEAPLRAHTLPYAIHKRECDEVVRYRAESLGDCHTYMLRPHIFAGVSVQNYMIGALRGTPLGSSKRAARMRAAGKRLPWLLPRGDKYLEKRFQFVHVDDMARLLVHLLNRPANDPPLTILNVAGRGETITVQRCAEIAQARIKRAPTRSACRAAFSLLWKLRISSIPPAALPYLIGSYTMDTTRLQHFLGEEYETVIQYTIEDALRDSFQSLRGSLSSRPICPLVMAQRAIYCRGCIRSFYANPDPASLSCAVVDDDSCPTIAPESGQPKRCSRRRYWSHDGCGLRELHQRVLHPRDAPRRFLSAEGRPRHPFRLQRQGSCHQRNRDVLRKSPHLGDFKDQEGIRYLPVLGVPG